MEMAWAGGLEVPNFMGVASRVKREFAREIGALNGRGSGLSRMSAGSGCFSDYLESPPSAYKHLISSGESGL